VQRGAALVAAFLGRVTQTQPLAARRAVGIQALDRSARQSKHRSLRFAAVTPEKHSVNERNSARLVLVSQEKYPLLVGVHFRGRIGRIFAVILGFATNLFSLQDFSPI
jgi:hypothetical protein